MHVNEKGSIMDNRQLTARRRLPPAQPVVRDYYHRQRLQISPKAIAAFVVLMAVLGCYAQLGWQITLAIFGTPVVLRIVFKFGRAAWNVRSALISWEIDLAEDFALAQGVSESRERKLERRLALAERDAKWRLLLKICRYFGLKDLKVLMVDEADSSDELLIGKCFDMWNEDRKWGNSFKMGVKSNVKAFYKVTTLGVGAVQREIEHHSDGWNPNCLYLCEQNHWLVYLVAILWFPTSNLQVEDEFGNELTGAKALAYMRHVIRTA